MNERLTKKIVDNTYCPIALGDSYEVANSKIQDKLGQYEDIDEDPEHLAKVNKALEIIKEKIVDYWLLTLCNSREEYNSDEPLYRQLTQEEYDLLKEILL